MTIEFESPVRALVEKGAGEENNRLPAVPTTVTWTTSEVFPPEKFHKNVKSVVESTDCAAVKLARVGEDGYWLNEPEGKLKVPVRTPSLVPNMVTVKPVPMIGPLGNSPSMAL